MSTTHSDAEVGAITDLVTEIVPVKEECAAVIVRIKDESRVSSLVQKLNNLQHCEKWKNLPLIIFVKDDAKVECLSEAAMRDLGWIRK